MRRTLTSIGASFLALNLAGCGTQSVFGPPATERQGPDAGLVIADTTQINPDNSESLTAQDFYNFFYNLSDDDLLLTAIWAGDQANKNNNLPPELWDGMHKAIQAKIHRRPSFLKDEIRYHPLRSNSDTNLLVATNHKDKDLFVSIPSFDSAQKNISNSLIQQAGMNWLAGNWISLMSYLSRIKALGNLASWPECGDSYLKDPYAILNRVMDPNASVVCGIPNYYLKVIYNAGMYEQANQVAIYPNDGVKVVQQLGIDLENYDWDHATDGALLGDYNVERVSFELIDNQIVRKVKRTPHPITFTRTVQHGVSVPAISFTVDYDQIYSVPTLKIMVGEHKRVAAILQACEANQRNAFADPAVQADLQRIKIPMRKPRTELAKDTSSALSEISKAVTERTR